jgi:hypothetical protein
MVVWQVWAQVFICQDHVYAHDGILRIFSSLQEHVHINVLDGLQLCLRCLNFVLIGWLDVLLLSRSASFRARFALGRSCLWWLLGLFLFGALRFSTSRALLR